jgi:hypothetical protein
VFLPAELSSSVIRTRSGREVRAACAFNSVGFASRLPPPPSPLPVDIRHADADKDLTSVNGAQPQLIRAMQPGRRQLVPVVLQWLFTPPFAPPVSAAIFRVRQS